MSLLLVNLHAFSGSEGIKSLLTSSKREFFRLAQPPRGHYVVELRKFVPWGKYGVIGSNTLELVQCICHHLD